MTKEFFKMYDTDIFASNFHNVDYSCLHPKIDEDQSSFMSDLNIFQLQYSQAPTIGLQEIIYGFDALSNLNPRSDEYHSTTIPAISRIALSLGYTAIEDSFTKTDLTELLQFQRLPFTNENYKANAPALVAQYTKNHNMSLHSTIEAAYLTALFDLKAIDREGVEIDFETEMGRSVQVHDIDLANVDLDIYDELDQIQQKIRTNLKTRTRELEYILAIASPSYFRKIKGHKSVKQYAIGSGFKPSFETGLSGKHQIAEIDNILFICAPDDVAARIGNGNGCLYLPKLTTSAAKELYPDFYTESQRKINGLQGQDDRTIRFCTWCHVNDKDTIVSVISDTSWLPIVRDPSLLVRSNWTA